MVTPAFAMTSTSWVIHAVGRRSTSDTPWATRTASAFFLMAWEHGGFTVARA